MNDSRYDVMAYVLEHMCGTIKVDVCGGTRLIAVNRNEDVCYVGADEWADKTGKVALLGSGRLRNDVERCLCNSGKYWVAW